MTRDILRVLGESSLPVPTPDLIAVLAEGKAHPRQSVWTALRYLQSAGMVERVEPRGWKPGRTVAWRLA